MTNTRTEDVDGTLSQIREAVAAGCDIARISCPSKEATVALREIIRRSEIPIVADIHFDYRRALEALDSGAHCVRINPGNINPAHLREIVRAASYCGSSIRIGINAGSLEADILEEHGEPNADALVESAVLNCRRLEDMGFSNFKISVKSSSVPTSIAAYRKLSRKVDYPLHVGITEAGPLFSGSIKSAIAIGALLCDGIGDTIRVSLSGGVVDEIRVGRQILRSLSLLRDGINIVSCPTCARKLIDVATIASGLEAYAETLLPHITISIIGCVVNGPGEAAKADIGVFGFKPGYAKICLLGVEQGSFKEDEVIPKVLELCSTLGADGCS
jgi:(E)-4-hydroxy-3-methylbut-2-enyl-diphosphate synthase